MNNHLKFAGFDRDLLRAMQLSYYVDSVSLVPDDVFDEMEREYMEKAGEALPVGSDLIESYTPAERALALYLQFRLGVRKP